MSGGTFCLLVLGAVLLASFAGSVAACIHDVIKGRKRAAKKLSESKLKILRHMELYNEEEPNNMWELLEEMADSEGYDIDVQCRKTDPDDKETVAYISINGDILTPRYNTILSPRYHVTGKGSFRKE